MTPFSALKTEVVGCFETSVPIYRTKWCHIPEERKTDIRNREIIKGQSVYIGLLWLSDPLARSGISTNTCLELPQQMKSIKSWAESGASWFKSAEVSESEFICIRVPMTENS
jgi:hypothetical protein